MKLKKGQYQEIFEEENQFMFQGKGPMTTYWLIGEKKVEGENLGPLSKQAF